MEEQLPYMATIFVIIFTNCSSLGMAHFINVVYLDTFSRLTVCFLLVILICSGFWRFGRPVSMLSFKLKMIMSHRNFHCHGIRSRYKKEVKISMYYTMTRITFVETLNVKLVIEII